MSAKIKEALAALRNVEASDPQESGVELERKLRKATTLAAAILRTKKTRQRESAKAPNANKSSGPFATARAQAESACPQLREALADLSNREAVAALLETMTTKQ